MTAERVERHVVCLGCGCACDDLEVSIVAGRVTAAANACALGARWLGDGSAPARVRVDGRDASLDDGLASIARLLRQARRALIVLAPGLSCEAQRAAVALADRCRTALDNVSSLTVRASVLAGQEIGRATATLGEMRNRADTVVLWDVDAARYPRLGERYAIEPIGFDVPDGRRGRRVLSVTVGAPVWRDADRHVAVAAAEEVATLEALAGLLAGTARPGAGPVWSSAQALADYLLQGRYVAVCADAEPPDAGAPVDRGRAAALCRLSQALNHRTRGAVLALRGGGNRTGAESAMVAQTGYPMAVEFAGGVPRYRPHDSGAAALANAAADAVLILGDGGALDAQTAAQVLAVPAAVVGPGATAGPLARSPIAIDTARAGIHEGGTALRLDDVPLPLRVLVPGPPAAVDLLTRLAALVA